MQKGIYFSIGSIEFENYIMNELNNKENSFYRIGRTQYAGGLEEYLYAIEELSENVPDIFMIKANLSEMTNERCLDIVQEIKLRLSARIILLSNDTLDNFEFHKNIVALGVYDIILGEQFTLDEIIQCIITPRTLADNKRFLSKDFKIKPIESPEVEPILPNNKKRKKFFPFGKKKHINSPDTIDASNTVNQEDVVLPFDKSLTKAMDTQNEGNIKVSQLENTINETDLYVNTRQVIAAEEGESEKCADAQQTNGFTNPVVPSTQTHTSGKRLFKKKEIVQSQMSMPRTKFIVSFLSLANGAGCSTVALNTAINLSYNNFKVLFIEMDTDWPLINSVYGFTASNALGLDAMAKSIGEGNYEDALRSIVTNNWLANVIDNKYIKNLSNVDYLSFSKLFIENRNTLDSMDFLTFLFMRTEYDFIVFDIGVLQQSDLHTQIIGYSGTVFTILNQSVSALLKYIEQIEQKSLDFMSKNNIVVNRYIPKTKLALSDFPESKNLLTIPDYTRDLINYDIDGIPLAANASHKINNDLSHLTDVVKALADK